MKTMYIGIYRIRKHTKNNTTKNTYTEEHIYIKNVHNNNKKEKYIHFKKPKKKEKKPYNLHKYT